MIGLDHVVLNIPANAVLRSEKCCQFEFIARGKDIRDVPKVGKHGRLVAHKAHSLTADEFDLVIEQCLDAEAMLYLVTGSLASSYYGEARFTQDADIAIWIGSEPDRVVPLCRRFEPPEFYVSVDAALQAATDRGQFNVIHTSTSFKIDFMVLCNSVYDRSRLERAREVELSAGVTARLASTRSRARSA